jgi:tetratricopeptide (TPR) repeat protein
MDTRLSMIEDMLRKNPNDVFLCYAVCLEYYKLGEKTEAIEKLYTLMKSFPDYLPTYYQLGTWLEEQNETTRAKGIYRKGITVAQKQNDAKTLGELSEALMILDENADMY